MLRGRLKSRSRLYLSFLPRSNQTIFAAVNKYLTDIVQYFEYLCTKHPALLHADASGARVFEVKPLEEAFGSFRSSAVEKQYFVRLALPTFTMSGNAGNARKTYQIGLLVGKWYSRREEVADAAILAATAAEKVFDEIISRVMADSSEGLALFGGYADSIGDLNIQGDYYFHEGDGSYAGVFATMDISMPRSMALECQTIVWTDGGVTPP